MQDKNPSLITLHGLQKMLPVNVIQAGITVYIWQSKSEVYNHILQETELFYRV